MGGLTVTLPALPGAYSAGDTPLASEINNLVTNVAFAVNPEWPGVHVRRTSSLTITSGTHLVITWQVAAADNAGMWSSGNPTVVTIKRAGWYVCLAGLRYSANAGAKSAYIMLNGTSQGANSIGGHLTAAGAPVIQVAALTRLAVNDVLRVSAHQDSGVSQSLSTDFGGVYFACVRLSA